MTTMDDLKQKYLQEAGPAMREKFGYRNVMSIPKITKAVINVGVGRFRDEKQLEEIRKYIALISGQQVAKRPAKKSIASFKTRPGMIVGFKVTLRGRRMYDFISRLINIALPRTRDFQGISAGSFDAKGNLTIGIKEHIVFPELVGEDYRFLFGFEVTIVTTAKKREEGIELLRLIGFPIQK